METKYFDQKLEILYRNQIKQNYNFNKQEFIKAKIGKNEKEIHLPIRHLLYFPRQILETILQHINNVEKINIDFEEQRINELIFEYYFNDFYKDIFKYWKETIRVWHTFNKNKYCGYNEPISEAEQCIKRIEEKWENGIDDLKEEIHFIEDNIDLFIEKKEEKFIKQIPFEILNTIIQQLPDETKLVWIRNFIPEGKDDLTRLRKIKAIGEMNIDEMSDEDIKKAIENIKSESESKWETKMNQRFQELKETIKKNKIILKEIRKKRELIKTEVSELRTILDEKNHIFEQFKEKQKNEEEVTKQINQLGSGLSKEQQLFKSSERGFVYSVIKLLDEGLNINLKDNHYYKRKIDKDGQH